MIWTAVTIKAWIAQIPSVDEVRPTRCVGCGSASRPVGGRVALHGHGLLHRQVRGVLELHGQPCVFAISVRRYACRSCGAVMTVVPAGMLARRLYSASSIALALYLWLVAGLSDREVRGGVCAWQLRGCNDRGWAQLYRWTRQATHLFELPRRVVVTETLHDVARRVLITLRSLAPVSMSAAPIALQIFEGAARTR